MNAVRCAFVDLMIQKTEMIIIYFRHQLCRVLTEQNLKKNYVGPVPTYCAAVCLTFDILN